MSQRRALGTLASRWPHTNGALALGETDELATNAGVLSGLWPSKGNEAAEPKMFQE
jgi:hypothetical protein